MGANLSVGSEVRYICKGLVREIAQKREGTWFVLDVLDCDLVLVGRHPDPKILNEVVVTKQEYFVPINCN